jgi:hypothetical protein
VHGDAGSIAGQHPGANVDEAVLHCSGNERQVTVLLVDDPLTVSGPLNRELFRGGNEGDLEKQIERGGRKWLLAGAAARLSLAVEAGHRKTPNSTSA